MLAWLKCLSLFVQYLNLKKDDIFRVFGEKISSQKLRI
jgi:hypothetical protein